MRRHEGRFDRLWLVGRDGHRHLVSLTREATIGVAPQRPARHLPGPLGQEGAERAPDLRRLEVIEGTVQRRQQIDALGGRREAEGGERTRVRRNDDRAYSERVREPAPEERPGATERQQRHAARIEAPGHAHALERARHHRGRDRYDPRGAARRLSPRRGVERPDSPFGGARVEPHLVRERAGSVEPAEHEAGVRDGGALAAPPVAGGPRHRAGALGAHLERAAGVYPRDAAAARTHRLDEHCREREGDAGDPSTRPPIAHGRAPRHEAGVGARASHVEGEELGEPQRRADEARPHDAARRTGERERRGARGGGGGRQRAAARRHDAQRRDAAPTDVALEPPQIGGDLGAEIRLEGRGARPLELAERREHFMARGDGHRRERVSQGSGDGPLVLGVAEGEEQRDRDRLGREAAHRRDDAAHFVVAERLQHPSRSHSLGDGHHVAAGHERRRVVAREIVQRGAVLTPQPQQVLEAAGRHEHDAGAGALEQGVGRDRRAVNEHGDGAGICIQGAEHRDRGIIRRRHHLPHRNRAVLAERDEVGEGAAHVHPHPHHHPPNAERGSRNAEQQWEFARRATLLLLFRVSTSAFRVGGVVMRVGVDVGGTFTDLVALGEDGTISVRKVVTTPDDPAVAMFRALDADPRPIAVLIHGTTIATNALLERTGARVVLVTTRGFEDLLWLRRQDRAALYDLARDHPPPLVARGDVVPVAERMGPGGVLEPLRDDEVRRIVAAVRGLAPEAVAVSLLFAFRHAEHERTIAAALRDALPAVPVAASHEVLPAFREFERTSTTTLEAYLRPKVATYLGRLERDVRGRGIATLRVMASSGGTLPPAAAAARAASLALSGPAGGVVGARLVGAALGLTELLTLDMGGTSADASLVTGGAPVSDGGTGGGVAGIPLALPAVLIETVSAGGGR